MTVSKLGNGLLSGLRVLDFSIWRPGPYATQLLAEIGADVLKIEPPGGDPMRSYPGLFASLNVNKRSIALDLKQDRDRLRALELAGEADAVIEGFRPGVAARLGIGYDEVRSANPTIIYCSISGMGQSGSLAFVPGHDLNYLAWAGVLKPEGGPPVSPSIPVADLSGGLAAAFGICAAAVRRAMTGEGDYIDLAMTDVLATWTGAITPRAVEEDSDIRGNVPGYGTFETADGCHIALGIVTEDHFWRSLCDVLGFAAHRDLDFRERLARHPELQQLISEAVRTRTRDDLVDELLASDVPVALVLDRAGMLNLAHFSEREVVTRDPWCEPATGYPVRFLAHPAVRTTPPPELDEHHGSGFIPR